MERGGCVEDDGSVALRASAEEERIMRNVSEGEKVFSSLAKT